MFRRNKQLSLGHKVVGFFWPAMGWRRSVKYLLHRLARLPGTAYSIAGGFACGAAVSFTPFVGLHFVISAIVAWIIRTNILASAIGTAVGNPWTFPFIWTWLYKTGTWITTGGTSEQVAAPDFVAVFGNMMEAILSLNGQYLLETAAPIFWPMLISSIPTGFVIWWVFYLPLKYIVQRYQDRRFNNLAEDLKETEK
ncbi:MAG: DUF2062 domain-containing protein [Proteobacteria bacterium]|nr:DUF2062 domain-containing protein [Pseudomonadota bacterium]